MKAPADPHPFGALLRRLRIRAGLSQNQAARSAGVDPAYVNRLERAEATSTMLPTRKVVLALAGVVEAGPVERERLLVAAGLCPEIILQCGWDAALADIAAALADPDMHQDARADLRTLLRIVAAQWRLGDWVDGRNPLEGSVRKDKAPLR